MLRLLHGIHEGALDTREQHHACGEYGQHDAEAQRKLSQRDGAHALGMRAGTLRTPAPVDSDSPTIDTAAGTAETG